MLDIAGMGDNPQKHKDLQKAHLVDFPTKTPEADGPFELASSLPNLLFFLSGPGRLPFNELLRHCRVSLLFSHHTTKGEYSDIVGHNATKHNSRPYHGRT